MTLGERLLQLRKDNGLSQESLAKMLYVTRQSISLWENDKAMPSIDLLKRLSSIYNISVDDLLGTEPIEPKPIAKANLLNSKKEVKQVFKFERSTSQTVLFTVMAGILLLLNSITIFEGDLFGLISSLVYALPLFIIWLVFKFKIHGNIKHYMSRNNNGYILFYAHHLSIVTDIEKPPVSIAYTSFKKTVETDEYLLLYLPNETAYCVDKNESEGYIDDVVNILSRNKSHKNKSVRQGTSPKGSTKKLMLIKNISNSLFVLTFFSIYFGLALLALTNSGIGFAGSTIIPFIGLVYAIVLKIKKCRGKKLIIASSIMLFFAIIYSSLFGLLIPSNTPYSTRDSGLNKEQFLSTYSAIFENNGYGVTQHEINQGLEGVTDYYIATSPDNDYTIDVYGFESNKDARRFYENTNITLRGSGYYEKTYVLGTTAMKAVTTSQEYFYIYTKDCVGIEVHTDLENKEEIETMLQKLGVTH